MSNKLQKILKKNEESFRVFYKLAVDFLAISVVATGLFLLSEGLLPGAASEKIGFIKMIFFIFLGIMAIFFSGRIIGASLGKKEWKKGPYWSLVAIFFLLLLSGLLSAGIILSIIIGLLSFWIFILVRRMIFEEE